MSDALDRSLGILMRNLAEVLTAAGVPADKALSSLEQALQKTKIAPAAKTPDFELGEAARLFYGSIVFTWTSSPEFLDDQGDPLDLPIDGPSPSLRHLVASLAEKNPGFSEQRHFDEALERLFKHGVVEKQADGTLKLLRDIFPVNQVGTISAVDQLDYMSTFASTSAHNVKYSGVAGRFQRACNVRNFPREALPVLNKMVEDEGMAFLTSINDYLESQSQPEPNRNRGLNPPLVGVGVYYYSDE